MPTALILGTSQAQSTAAGGKLEKRLKQQGYTVTRSARHGANIKQTLADAEALPSHDFDLVVIFQWDADPGLQAVQAIVDQFPQAKQIVWYGASPATLIANLGAAKKAFPKVDAPDYWFSQASGPYYKVREDKNTKLKAYFAKHPRVQYVDWRDLEWLDAVEQPSGIMFPNLPDGIHITGGVAEQAFAPGNWPPTKRKSPTGPFALDWRKVAITSGAVLTLGLLALYLRRRRRQAA